MEEVGGKKVNMKGEQKPFCWETPDGATANEFGAHAYHLLSKGNVEKALDRARKALELDPMNNDYQGTFWRAAREKDPKYKDMRLRVSEMAAIYDSDQRLASLREMMGGISEKSRQEGVVGDLCRKSIKSGDFRRILEIRLEKLFSDIPPKSDLYIEIDAEAQRRGVNFEDAVPAVRAAYESEIRKVAGE